MMCEHPLQHWHRKERRLDHRHVVPAEFHLFLATIFHMFFGNGLPIAKDGMNRFSLIYKTHCGDLIATGFPAELMVVGMG